MVMLWGLSALDLVMLSHVILAYLGTPCHLESSVVVPPVGRPALPLGEAVSH